MDEEFKKLFSKNTMFQPLQKYFNFPLKKLSLFNDRDLLKTTESSDHLLMKMFIEEELKGYLFQPNIFGPTGAKGRWEIVEEKQPQNFTPQEGALDLSERVISNRWKKIQTHLVPIHQVINIVSFAEKVTMLDLSMNGLFDEDIMSVQELVAKFTSCKVVDLSYNRISGENEETIKCLEGLLKNLDYLSIAGNAIATTDCISFFKRKTKEQLQKLIWIPCSWIVGGDWKSLVDKKFWVDVGSTHKAFYKLFPDKHAPPY